MNAWCPYCGKEITLERDGDGVLRGHCDRCDVAIVKQETPPPLGVAVTETLHAGEKVG